MKTKIIERGGKKFAMVPLKDFELFKHDAEMLSDIQAYDAAKTRQDEAFPPEVARRLISGENPVKVFREFRGLTQHQLAKVAKIARAYLAEIEVGRKQGSVSVLKAIAAARMLEIDDIVN